MSRQIVAVVPSGGGDPSPPLRDVHVHDREVVGVVVPRVVEPLDEERAPRPIRLDGGRRPVHPPVGQEQFESAARIDRVGF